MSDPFKPAGLPKTPTTPAGFSETPVFPAGRPEPPGTLKSTPASAASPAASPQPGNADEDHAIQERAREMTAQAFQGRRVEGADLRNLVQAVTGGSTAGAEAATAESRQAFADAVKMLNDRLLNSANDAHVTLSRLAARGKDFTDNDLKDALVSLRGLQENYVATVNRIAGVAAGNLSHELTELATHAQNAGAEATARLATVISDLAGRMGSFARDGASSGLETARSASVRMALLASGVFAGVADAMRGESGTKKK